MRAANMLGSGEWGDPSFDMATMDEFGDDIQIPKKIEAFQDKDLGHLYIIAPCDDESLAFFDCAPPMPPASYDSLGDSCISDFLPFLSKEELEELENSRFSPSIFDSLPPRSQGLEDFGLGEYPSLETHVTEFQTGDPAHDWNGVYYSASQKLDCP
jgi:hypothetical protein